MKQVNPLLKILLLLVVLSNYVHAFYDSTQGRWVSRDPIQEQGGINLYGFAANDGANRTDYLGYAAVDPELMYDTVHTVAMAAHLKAEVEYLGLLKSKDPYVTPPDINNGRKYKPASPKEYGGRVCENCEIKDDGTKVYTYYLTETSGLWPHIRGFAEIYMKSTPACNEGDKQVAFWHTHPSELVEERNKDRIKPSRYYWAGNGGFSGADLKLPANKMQNPDGLPLFVTYRGAPSYREWTYITKITPGTIVRESESQPVEWLTFEGGVRP